MQKSRFNRLIEGDKNTTFHHMFMIVRRSRNQISCIKNDMGAWINSEFGAMNYIKERFRKLFTTTLVYSLFHLPPPSKWQAVLSKEDKGSLNMPVSKVEIKEGLWAFKLYKSSGSNGLHTVYKIVTNIIVARLRPHVDKLVRPLQSAFVPGRRSVDNAIMVQELIHTISNRKGRGGYMAIKVDLKKAYDKIEWSFITEVLINANFPHNLVNLIMCCVSSVSTSILFNGGSVKHIFPSQGIRKGDPLSPYLFILCMEVLGHFIEDKCNENSWVPVKSSQSGMAFSHLFFCR